MAALVGALLPLQSGDAPSDPSAAGEDPSPASSAETPSAGAVAERPSDPANLPTGPLPGGPDTPIEMEALDPPKFGSREEEVSWYRARLKETETLARKRDAMRGQLLALRQAIVDRDGEEAYLERERRVEQSTASAEERAAEIEVKLEALRVAK